MTEHSKEPWSYDGDLDEVSNSDGLIGDIVGIWGPDNIERACACVNALAGLKPKHVGELVEAVDRLSRCLRTLHEVVYPTNHDGMATCSSCEQLAAASALLAKVKA